MKGRRRRSDVNGSMTDLIGGIILDALSPLTGPRKREAPPKTGKPGIAKYRKTKRRAKEARRRNR